MARANAHDPAEAGPCGVIVNEHKPNSVPSAEAKWATIHLGPPLPKASSSRPVLVPRTTERFAEADHENCLRLHAVGFAVPRLSPAGRCALTAPFHPYLP